MLKDFDATKARSYVPLAEKTAFIESNVWDCIEKCEIKLEGEIYAPPMHKENVFGKQKIMMKALVELYLQDKYTDADYDSWGESHIINQIERKKSDLACKNFCFDLLADYKEFGKMLNSEIYGTVACMNDTVSRLMESTSKAVTPEAMQELMQSIEQIKAEAEALKAKE